MFKIALILISVITVVILYQYYYKRRYGLWIDPIENSSLEMDDSMVWKTKFLNFNIFSKQSPVSVPPDSKLISFFKGVYLLDVYDEKLNHVRQYYNPKIVIHEEGKDLFSKKRYYMMIRYHSSFEEQLEATTFMEVEDKKIQANPVYEIGSRDYYDELFYREESKMMMDKIVDEMEQKGYELLEVSISDIRRSFPSSLLINEIDIELEPDMIIVVLVTNKKKLFDLKTHAIEFSSEEKNFVWHPEGKNNFCSLILEEGNDDVEISIREYLYCEKSKILPITAMLFIPEE